MFCIHLKKKKLKIKLFYMIFNELLVSQTGTPDLWDPFIFIGTTNLRTAVIDNYRYSTIDTNTRLLT